MGWGGDVRGGRVSCRSRERRRRAASNSKGGRLRGGKGLSPGRWMHSQAVHPSPLPSLRPPTSSCRCCSRSVCASAWSTGREPRSGWDGSATHSRCPVSPAGGMGRWGEALMLQVGAEGGDGARPIISCTCSLQAKPTCCCALLPAAAPAGPSWIHSRSWRAYSASAASMIQSDPMAASGRWAYWAAPMRAWPGRAWGFGGSAA